MDLFLQGRFTVAALIIGLALLVALIRAVIEESRARREKRRRRQPPLPMPPADARGIKAPPALQPHGSVMRARRRT